MLTLLSLHCHLPIFPAFLLFLFFPLELNPVHASLNTKIIIRMCNILAKRKALTQPAFTCTKLAVGTLEQHVKHVLS